MTPQQYVQAKAAGSGSSFYYAFLFLPAERRAAITAFYAFCREVDDVVDEISDPSVAQSTLAWWQKEVLQAYAGQPSHPVMHALMPLAPNFGIESRHLMAVIEGCQMDLAQNRYLDYPALTRYCHLVAGIVGEVAARIFGQTDPATTAYAHKLGQAFQLTNIIRDVGEDARRNRVYLPLDELAAAGIEAAQIVHVSAAVQSGDAFRQLMTRQVERAQAAYESAFAKLPAADRKPQLPGIIMAAIYRTLLEEIRADGCRVLTHRTSLPPARKLWIALKTWIKG